MTGSARRWAPWAIYVLFAAAVFVLHGMEPPLIIDHVAYMRQTEDVMRAHPDGQYWRSWDPVYSYDVMLAYLYPLTRSHILSFKVMLALVTVAYLAAFQLFMRLAGAKRWEAVLFSLLSCLFVSFGASMWGMTDFAASVNRTIVLPFAVAAIWFHFSRPESLWRYCVYPFLVLVSQLHLSAFHVLLVFLVYEGLDFAVRRRFRPDRRAAAFAAAFLLAIGLQAGLEGLGHKGGAASVGAGEFIRRNVAGALSRTDATQAIAANDMSPAEAWRTELFAFPWRNMPPSVGTLGIIALSFGVIFLLACWGAYRRWRHGPFTRLDGDMLLFALATVVAAYGLQLSLWLLRQFTRVYPVNFEEVRAVNLLMVPAVYFVFRLYRDPPRLGALGPSATRVAILCAFALQPIHALPLLPVAWRQRLLEAAASSGALTRGDPIRMQYARDVLGLSENGARYYYSAAPAIAWLDSHAAPGDKVMTNLNEFYVARVKTEGLFLQVIDTELRGRDRLQWFRTQAAVDRALSSRDMAAITSLAKSLGAAWIVLPYPYAGASYSDRYYSIVKVA